LVACIWGRFGKKSRVMICDRASVYVSSYSRQQALKLGGESDLHPRLVVYTTTLNRSLGLRILEALVQGAVSSHSPLTYLVLGLTILGSEMQDRDRSLDVRKGSSYRRGHALTRSAPTRESTEFW
jgi:hypothetical protein